MNGKRFRVPSHIRRDESYVGIRFHPEMTLLLFTCSSQPEIIDIRIEWQTSDLL